MCTLNKDYKLKSIIFRPNECKELLPSTWIISEHTQHGACHCAALRLAHTSHCHTHVPVSMEGRST